jgi:hypothetical protein
MMRTHLKTNPKSEIRMTKEENPNGAAVVSVTWICFGFRISDFGFVFYVSALSITTPAFSVSRSLRPLWRYVNLR